MQRGWFVTLVLLMTLVVLVSPAFAEDKTGSTTKADPSPPHIFTPVRIDLLIWTLVVFLTLFFLLKKTAWGPILEGLHKREEAIRGAVEEAKLARKETEEVRAKFQKEMDEAFAKIPHMMDEARRDAARLAEEMKAKSAADIQADRDRLRREIEMAKDQALQEIWNQTANLVAQTSAKVIPRQLSEEDHRRLVEMAMDSLRRPNGTN